MRCHPNHARLLQLKGAATTDKETAKLLEGVSEANFKSWLREPCKKRSHRGIVNVTVNQFCSILSASADLMPMEEFGDFWQMVHEEAVRQSHDPVVLKCHALKHSEYRLALKQRRAGHSELLDGETPSKRRSISKKQTATEPRGQGMETKSTESKEASCADSGPDQVDNSGSAEASAEALGRCAEAVSNETTMLLDDSEVSEPRGHKNHGTADVSVTVEDTFPLPGVDELQSAKPSGEDLGLAHIFSKKGCTISDDLEATRRAMGIVPPPSLSEPLTATSEARGSKKVQKKPRKETEKAAKTPGKTPRSVTKCGICNKAKPHKALKAGLMIRCIKCHQFIHQKCAMLDKNIMNDPDFQSTYACNNCASTQDM